jgi:diguanylate cyclase (GGDEF)-like protein/PAS domain S-box-containing protein
MAGFAKLRASARRHKQALGSYCRGLASQAWGVLSKLGSSDARLKNAQAVADAAVARATAAHKRLREALEILPQGIVFLDSEGRYILWNQKYADIYKRSADLFRVGVRLEDTLRIGVARGDYPAAVGREEEWLAERLQLLYSPGQQHEQVLADGRCVLIEERRTSDGGVIGLRMDITAIKQREASFRLLFEDNPVPMFVIRRDARSIMAANAAALTHYGYDRNVACAMVFDDLSASPERGGPDAKSAVSQGVETCRHRTASGKVIEVVTFSRFLDYEGVPAVLIAIIDITERKEAEARIAHMAHHDALTDMPNRVLLRERMAEALAQRTRNNKFLGMLCLDLDNFKLVNDTLGHPVGDRLLQAVAERIQSVVRKGETAARLGGDEFAVLVPEASTPEEVSVLARRLIEVVGEPYKIDDTVVTVGTTVGIAVPPGDGEDADHLLRNADMALYRAKADGKGTYRFFEPEMDARAQARRRLEIDLRTAIAEENLEVHYQPLVDFATDKITGLEALLRWPHPERGSIPPSEFIPLAEETGLITSLGRFVLRRACKDATLWPDGVMLAVNLSPLQFRVGNVFLMVKEALEETGLKASRLDLEITESVLLEKTDQVIASLHALRALGVRISMDDFGTGYSSLSYLRSFPFDKIKIDRSFVRDLESNQGTRAIVRAVLGLAAGLDMKVVAEGIENKQDLAYLMSEGCREGQGFLFSRARPQAEILKMLTSEKRCDVA